MSVEVSVIVPTYNREGCLRNTLNDLLLQDPAPLEIIVVDQSESHQAETTQHLTELRESGRIRYFIQIEPNAQKARNLGIREARGEVLLFIDDDVKMDINLIGAHWKNYCADPLLVAVCGFYLRIGERPLNKLPDYCRRPLTGWIYTPHSYTGRIESYSLPTCNGSVRRDVAIQLGGFDENYTHTYLDDVDFSCRLRQLGVKAVHDPEARLIHLKEPSGGKRPGRIGDHAGADSNSWYVWCYFFWINFGWRSWRELAGRFRRSVLGRRTLLRPWRVPEALNHCIRGAWRAARAIRGGRKLGLSPRSPAHRKSIGHVA